MAQSYLRHAEWPSIYDCACFQYTSIMGLSAHGTQNWCFSDAKMIVFSVVWGYCHLYMRSDLLSDTRRRKHPRMGLHKQLQAVIHHAQRGYLRPPTRIQQGYPTMLRLAVNLSVCPRNLQHGSPLGCAMCNSATSVGSQEL